MEFTESVEMSHKCYVSFMDSRDQRDGMVSVKEKQDLFMSQAKEERKENTVPTATNVPHYACVALYILNMKVSNTMSLGYYTTLWWLD